MSIANALVWLRRIENGILSVLVLVLVALSGAQIVMRNLFGGGFTWADPFLRTLVVWTAMLGALSAVREDKHIAIDVLQRFLPPAGQRAARIVTFLIAAAMCAAMAWYGWTLVSVDFAGAAQSEFGLPNWVLEAILPVGFALMAVRFALRAFVAPTHAGGWAAAELLSAGEGEGIAATHRERADS